MAFTLEDGTGVAGANAYASVQDVTDYLTDRGRGTEASWDTIGIPAQQAAIIKATDYIEKNNCGKWKGDKANTDQGLSWPRIGVLVDGAELADNEVPEQIIQATAEYAIRALSASLLPDPVSGTLGQQLSGSVTRLKEKVGDIEVDTSYAGPSYQKQIDPSDRAYPEADLLLKSLINSPGLNGFVGRV